MYKNYDPPGQLVEVIGWTICCLVFVGLMCLLRARQIRPYQSLNTRDRRVWSAKFAALVLLWIASGFGIFRREVQMLQDDPIVKLLLRSIYVLMLLGGSLLGWYVMRYRLLAGKRGD